MKKPHILLLTSLGLLLSPLVQAQMYKWVGPDGKITYSDTPPPANVAKVEKKAVNLNGPADAGLPFELLQAVRNAPVTLYTAPGCGPCDAGRNMLRTRGIPFSEKTVNSSDDQTKYRQISGGNDLPFITVGSARLKGFESSAWTTALNAASYPETSQLPRNYQYRAAEPLVPPPPPPPPKPSASPAPSPTTTPRPSPTPNNNPPGFQF